MSGIIALLHRDGRPVETGEITTMLMAAAHRGPDGVAAHVMEDVGLGHAKMAVTPEEETERQPLISPRTGAVIVADVRLDNRDELLALLPHDLPSSASDAELLLRAYDEWGADLIHRLLGDFAFIIWDPRRQRMFCARDTSGQRTLYYRLNADTFAAASEIQQLLQDPAVPLEPNEEHIRESLVPFNMFRNEKDTAETYFAGIYAVPAGHTLLVERDREQLRRYWELQPPRELRYRTDDEYAEHYRALFFEVVRTRLRTSRPVGVLLSGGLDSSSIACTAQQLYRTSIIENPGFTSFTFAADDQDWNERPLIEDMQALYSFDARFLAVGQLGGRLQLEPTGFREAPNMGVAETRNAVFSAAGHADVRTLLTGDMADACVGGSRLVFDSLLRHGDVAAFRRHLRAYRRVSTESLLKFAVFGCLLPLLPLSIHSRVKAAYFRRLIVSKWPRVLPQWMGDELREELTQRHLTLMVEGERHRRFANETREGEYHLLYPPEMAQSLAPWSIHMVRPFADRRLHEFLLAIPPELKFEPHPDTNEFYAGSKQIVRRAMRDILPESIRTRTTKTVFNSVASAELTRQWSLYEAAFGPSGRSLIVERGYVRQGPFWTKLQALRAGESSYDMVYLMRLVEMETWLRALALPRPRAVQVATPVAGEQLSLGTA